MRRRTFLEPPSSVIDSYVATDIADGNISLKLADCNRAVTLDFSVGRWQSRDVAHAMTKLNKIRAALDRIELALDKADDSSE